MKIFASLILLFFIAVVISRFFPTKAETSCKSLPDELIVFAPAFTNLGKNSDGGFLPGAANLRIIEKIGECAARNKIRTVLTQLAVSDSIPAALAEKTQIQQMHVHCDGVYFNTYHAMRNAVTENLLAIENNEIALIAHPKHLFRSRMALQKALQQSELHNKSIHLIHLKKSPYSNPDNLFEPFIWATRELFAVPLQFVQALLKPSAIPACPKGLDKK